MTDLEQRPYCLGVTDALSGGSRWIGAKGPYSVLQTLSTLPQSQWVLTDPGEESNYLLFPATRLNAMIAEAVATPAEVAMEYRHWRNSAMEPQLAWKYLSDAVIDGSNCRRIPLVHQTDFLAHLIGSEARGMINASEMGCVAAGTLVSINRGGRGRKITVESLWERFHGHDPKARWQSEIPTRVRSLCDGEFRLHTLINVLRKGTKPVLRVVLESGKEIRLTGDHEIARPYGDWTRADALRPGDTVLCNGMVARGSLNPHWKGGRHVDKDGYVRVSGMQGHPREQSGRGWVYEHLLVMESMIGRPVLLSEKVHHIDENKANNAPDNLKLCSGQQEHMKQHPGMHTRLHGSRNGRACFLPVIDTVVSVEPDGESVVYDLVMDDPHRNFVANGIVVHNCGKTAVGWWSLCAWKAQRALIVCPKSLMREWEREWKAMWPADAPIRPVVLDKGSTTQRAKWLRSPDLYCPYPINGPMAVILNYEVVHALEKEILGYAPDCIVLDESFRAKNPDAQVTKSLIRIADKADYVLELTGTPIGNHIGDLWSQLRLLGKEAMPEGYHAFLRKYATLQSVQLGPRTIQKPVGIADPAGLMERLAPYWYRATKASCLHLPPKRYETVRLTMLRETRELYQAVKKQGTAALGNEMSLDSEAVVGIRLHQIAGGHEPYLYADGSVSMKQMRCLKIEWLKQFAKDQLEANPTSRCIVWARYTHELRRITQTLRAALGENRVQMCWGETDNEALEAWKASFQSRSEEGVQVLVCQIKKMAFGHNLQAADAHVFFSNSWSYVERAQAEDRSHRAGRADSVCFFDLVLQGTIDEEIKEALSKKQDFSLRVCLDTTSSG